MRIAILPVLTLALAVPFAAHAQTTINFADYFGQSLSSADGVSFTLAGGDGPGGVPSVNSFGNPAIGNSPTGDYPTSEQLIFTFSAPASAVSFFFSNYGDNNAFGEPTTYTAYDGATAVSSANIGSDNGVLETVGGSDITSLVIDNGTGGDDDWEFGVYNLTFDAGAVSATPEPASFVTLGTGLLGVAGQLYRRRRSMR